MNAHVKIQTNKCFQQKFRFSKQLYSNAIIKKWNIFGIFNERHSGIAVM